MLQTTTELQLLPLFVRNFALHLQLAIVVWSSMGAKSRPCKHSEFLRPDTRLPALPFHITSNAWFFLQKWLVCVCLPYRSNQANFTFSRQELLLGLRGFLMNLVLYFANKNVSLFLDLTNEGGTWVSSPWELGFSIIFILKMDKQGQASGETWTILACSSDLSVETATTVVLLLKLAVTSLLRS